MIKKLATAGLVIGLTMASFTTVFAQTKFGYTTSKGIRYEIGMDGKTALSSLGTPRSSRDVNTCANGYANKAYTYGTAGDEIEIYVERVEGTGKDVVAGITLFGQGVSTEEGLKVGDTEDKIQKIYPSAKKGLGSYKVVDGQEEIYIKIQGGKVSYISYSG